MALGFRSQGSGLRGFWGFHSVWAFGAQDVLGPLSCWVLLGFYKGSTGGLRV